MTKRQGRDPYHGVLSIPKGRSGKFRVEHVRHEAGVPVQSRTWRVAFFGGTDAGRRVTYPHPTTWHALTEGGTTWMTDYPLEQAQCDALVRGMRGTVLVGGLGLGYAATAIAGRASVRRVVVVEKSPDVAKLVWPHLGRTVARKAELVVADLFDYLKAPRRQSEWSSGAAHVPPERYDHGFYDIWAHDGEQTFHKVVVPLRRLSQGLVLDVRAWNEDVMRGQLLLGLVTRVQMVQAGMHAADQMVEEASKSMWTSWALPYWRWHAAASPGLKEAQRAAEEYVALYGRPEVQAVINQRFQGKETA